MAELVRGQLTDRPWGMTLGALGIRGLSGQLTVTSEGKAYSIAFRGGAIIGAVSPVPTDAAVRVALTNGLISSTQVSDITRKLAAAAGRDEVDVIAEAAKLSPELTTRLRRRVVAQRAARSFALTSGSFVATDNIAIPIVAGCELDIRAVVYLGARSHLTEHRFSDELPQFADYFVLRPEANEDLPQYGFGDGDKALLAALADGGTLPELVAAHPTIGAQSIYAVVYALASCSACDLKAERPREPRAKKAPPPVPRADELDGETQQRNVEIEMPTMFRQPELPTTPMERLIRPPSASDGVRAQPVAQQRPVTAAPPMGRTPTTPPPMSRTPTIPPAVARTATRPPEVTRSPTIPPRAGTGSSPPPNVARTATRPPTGSPVIARTPTSQPTRGRTSTHPPRSRSASVSRPPERARRDSISTRETMNLITSRLEMLEQGANHFDLLGVPFESPVDVVRTSYFGLARRLHPDKLASLGIVDEARSAQRVFAEINLAFAVLTDVTRRAEYIDILSRGGQAAINAEQAMAADVLQRAMTAEDAFRQGEMALRRDSLPQAIESFKRAVELAPNEPDYEALLAWAYFCAAPDKMAIAQETKRALDRAVRGSNRPIVPKFYLGRVERMLGRDREALAHFQAVLELNPTHPEATSELRVLESRLATSEKPGGLFSRLKR